MFLKEYLKKEMISIKNLSQKTGVAYSTINDLVNGKTDAASCKAGMLKSIADVLDLSLDQIYEMCHYAIEINQDEIIAKLYVKNQNFCIKIIDHTKSQENSLFRINSWNKKYLREIGIRELSKYIKQKEREEICITH